MDENRTIEQIADEAIVLSLIGGRDAFVLATVVELEEIGITVTDEMRQVLNRLAERSFAAGALDALLTLPEWEKEHGGK